MAVQRLAKSTQRGVTSIEYALLAALIVLAIIASISAVGFSNGGLWSRWTGEFLQAIGAGGG